MCNRTARCILINRVRALMLALALVFVQLMGLFQASAESDGMLRVKLTRLGAPTSIQLTADCDYYLASDPSVRVPAGETATVAAKDGGMTLTFGDSEVSLGNTAKLMRAAPGKCGIRFIQPELSNRFCGDLGLSSGGDVISALLNIYIEDYLYGVVGYCMPPSAGVDALKAAAVAARTWALRRRAARGNSAYDLTDTGELTFKGYCGADEYANVIQAVDDTRGGVLYYNNALAQCGMCVSNGGQTESSKNAGGANLAYSVVRDDIYDYESKAAPVKTAVVNKDLSGVSGELYAALTEGVRDELQKRHLSAEVESFKLMSIESVTACDSRFPAPSRLYKSLTFRLNVTGIGADGTARAGSVSVSVPTYGAFEDWYDLSLNPEDNETVWVTEGDKAFTIAFRRSGSGVGLSQRGAQAMAERGIKASDILLFYFPGVDGRRLSLTDTTRDQRTPEPSAEQRPVATARLLNRTNLLDAADDGAAPTATIAAGAVVDIYGARGAWAAVGSSGKYGFIRVDCLESFALRGATVANEAIDGHILSDAEVYRLPATGAEVLGKVSKNDTVRVLAYTDAWRMIEWRDGTGFVKAEAVDTGEPEVTEDSEAEDAFVAVNGSVSAQLKQDAPLFEMPNALSPILETLKQGDVVKLLACSREWARVRTMSGKEGCLRLESIAAMDEPAPNDAIEGGAIQKVKGKKFMFVTTGTVAMYASWSETSDVMQTLFCGERVQVGAYNSAWACVRANGQLGYVRVGALAANRPAPVEGGAFTRAKAGFEAVAVNDLTVYAAPNADAQTAAMLEKGQRVSVEAYNSVWALVHADGAAGYARLQSLQRVQN